jgi:two-component system, NarL family, nitrate/nitrite response regulator NarL
MVFDHGSPGSLKVLAASAVPIRRAQWLQALQRIATVHEVVDRQTLELKMVALKPAILLLDLALLELRGRGGFAEIQTLSPSTKIILLTKSPTDNEGTAMLEAGARGYCSTDMDAVLLMKAVKMVQKGEVWVGRKVISHLLDILVALTEQQRNRALPNADPSFDVLTPREKEIVQQIGGGSSNKEIAHQLNVSEKTVKAHLTSIFRKLGVSDRLHLALYVNGHRPSFRA